MRSNWYRKYGKRISDLLGAGLLLVALSPLLAMIAIAVRVMLGGPVLFRQVRAGHQGQAFAIYKFRTMTDKRDNNELLPDAQRLTWFGKMLRASSLDELPELWNVVRGDMSLVGPRPLLVQYLELYDIEQARRHEVKPGITGLAQVRGRNAISWEERFEYDVDYVERVSLTGDLRIMLETVRSVLSRSGVSADGHATCPYFLGSPQTQASNKQRAA